MVTHTVTLGSVCEWCSVDRTPGCHLNKIRRVPLCMNDCPYVLHQVWTNSYAHSHADPRKHACATTLTLLCWRYIWVKLNWVHGAVRQSHHVLLYRCGVMPLRTLSENLTTDIYEFWYENAGDRLKHKIPLPIGIRRKSCYNYPGGELYSAGHQMQCNDCAKTFLILLQLELK